MATITVNVSDAMLEELAQILKSSGGRPGIGPMLMPPGMKADAIPVIETTSLQRVTDYVIQSLKSVAIAERQRIRNTDGAAADQKAVDQAFS